METKAEVLAVHAALQKLTSDLGVGACCDFNLPSDPNAEGVFGYLQQLIDLNAAIHAQVVAQAATVSALKDSRSSLLLNSLSRNTGNPVYLTFYKAGELRKRRVRVCRCFDRTSDTYVIRLDLFNNYSVLERDDHFKEADFDFNVGASVDLWPNTIVWDDIKAFEADLPYLFNVQYWHLKKLEYICCSQILLWEAADNIE